MRAIERGIVTELWRRLTGSPNFLQIVVGPRQVGKTTASQQVLRKWKGPQHYASADLPSPPDAYWIQAQWEIARQEARQHRKKTLLVLDEVQKIPRWSEVVKAMVDEDRWKHFLIRAVLLGSSSLHIHRGSRESLAGRFELLFCPHWTWPECRRAFGWSLDEWLFYGGYPGAAPLVRTPKQWSRFISESLIESVLSRDVLQLAPVVKPALLRQLFMLAVHSHAQILSYNKMLGQLQDAGNTVTLAHYLNLLSSAYLVSGLSQWTGGIARVRASSPKLVVWNNALVTALAGGSFREMRPRRDLWGRLVENAVGAHLLNHDPGSFRNVYYWRQGNSEIDYVLHQGEALLAIEVKTGAKPSSRGLDPFRRQYPRAKALVVGTGGIPLEKFFSVPPETWL